MPTVELASENSDRSSTAASSLSPASIEAAEKASLRRRGRHRSPRPRSSSPSSYSSATRRRSGEKIDGILAAIKNAQKEGTEDIPGFSITPAEYIAFCQAVPEQLRYDWDAENGVLRLRMPTPLHEKLTALLSEHTLEQVRKTLRHLGRENEAALYESTGGRVMQSTGTIEDDRTPDAVIFQTGSAHPSFVVEVAYSHPLKEAYLRSYLTEFTVSGVLYARVGYRAYNDRMRSPDAPYEMMLSLWRDIPNRDDPSTSWPRRDREFGAVCISSNAPAETPAGQELSIPLCVFTAQKADEDCPPVKLSYERIREFLAIAAGIQRHEDAARSRRTQDTAVVQHAALEQTDTLGRKRKRPDSEEVSTESAGELPTSSPSPPSPTDKAFRSSSMRDKRVFTDRVLLSQREQGVSDAISPLLTDKYSTEPMASAYATTPHE